MNSDAHDSPQIAHLRRDYQLRALLESEAPTEPHALFAQWLADAIAAHQDKIIAEPNAMVLSTLSPTGQPRGRTVLLKGYDSRGFVFYTNYTSTKGNQLAASPLASLTFGWLELERQVCIEGSIEKVSLEQTATYFHSRPRGSQLGAWASPQSQVVPDRATLEQHLADTEARFAEQPVIPPPPNWGGYRLIPTVIEFWQGRTNRLHDRLRYTRQAEGTWLRERLAP